MLDQSEILKYNEMYDSKHTFCGSLAESHCILSVMWFLHKFCDELVKTENYSGSFSVFGLALADV